MDRSVTARIRAIRDALSSDPGVPAWVTADSAAVQAIARGEEPESGPRGVWLRRLFGLLGASLAGAAALRAIAVTLGVVNWIRCRRTPREEPAACVVVGMGAGSEATLVREIREESGEPVAFVDQTRPGSLGSVACPPLVGVVRASWRTAGQAARALQRSSNPWIRTWRPLWMVSAARRIGSYALFRAWADCLPSRVTRLVFLATDGPAFAASDARCEGATFLLEHRQHGFIRWSVAQPRFDAVVALSAPEVRHFERTGGDVRLAPVPVLEGSRVGNVLLLASSYDAPRLFCRRDHVGTLEELLRWSVGAGMEPVVRPHPREAPGFWESGSLRCRLDPPSQDLRVSIRRWDPRLVVGWPTTALLDALAEGVLPVLLIEGASPFLEDMVFPLAEVACIWPRDRALIEQCLGDPYCLARELRCRRQVAFGAVDRIASGDAPGVSGRPPVVQGEEAAPRLG